MRLPVPAGICGLTTPPLETVSVPDGAGDGALDARRWSCAVVGLRGLRPIVLMEHIFIIFILKSIASLSYGAKIVGFYLFPFYANLCIFAENGVVSGDVWIDSVLATSFYLMKTVCSIFSPYYHFLRYYTQILFTCRSLIVQYFR